MTLLSEQVSAWANWEGTFLLLMMRNSYPLHAFWVFRSITNCWGQAWGYVGGVGAYLSNMPGEMVRGLALYPYPTAYNYNHATEPF